jgi:hypothetical protein
MSEPLLGQVCLKLTWHNFTLHFREQNRIKNCICNRNTMALCISRLYKCMFVCPWSWTLEKDYPCFVKMLTSPSPILLYLVTSRRSQIHRHCLNCNASASKFTHDADVGMKRAPLYHSSYCICFLIISARAFAHELIFALYYVMCFFDIPCATIDSDN